MSEKINTDKAPEPVGSYPHARRVGNLLFLSGVGPRKPGTKVIPGVMVDGVKCTFGISSTNINRPRCDSSNTYLFFMYCFVVVFFCGRPIGRQHVTLKNMRHSHI